MEGRRVGLQRHRAPVSNALPPGKPVRATPRYSIIAAVHNVGRYLPDFIASLEAQTFTLDSVEIILVDDGSTDDSPEILARWQVRRPDIVKVFTQENAGQGAARNLGLAHATGEWVTFPDPDDTISPDYLSNIDRFLRGNPEAVIACAYRVLHFDENNEFSDTHPLRHQFRSSDRVVDLDANERYFYGSAPCAFFLRARIVEAGLRFDSRIRPNFEDGHFVVMYLLASPTRRTGFVTSAVYNYRKRGDGSSTLQNSLMDPRRYTVVPELGYLDALDKAAIQFGGRPPGWLQTHILYELSWYFAAEERASGSATAASGDTGAAFVGHLRRIAARLDDRIILTFNVRHLSVVARQILLHLGSRDWHSPYVVSTAPDEQQRLTRVAVRFTGPQPPHTTFTRRGRTVEPVHAKTIAFVRFGSTLLKERQFWLPGASDIVTQVNGEVLPVQDRWPTGPNYRAPRAVRPVAPPRPTFSARFTSWLARQPPFNRVFARAWVLMDRTQDADDSAELLFRHLRGSRRDINAWFVVEKGTPDWKRLRADGFKRIVPYGSLFWKVLMANADHLISSHADRPVVNPPALAGIDMAWRFTFLQHGVIKDDISSWLNPKPIDLFVTSTTAEYQYIAGDNSPFRYSSREVKLTGLPRFDRLHRIGNEVDESQQDLVLVAPTWRSWLLPPLKGDTQRREFNADVLDTEYVRKWTDLLRSEQIRQLASKHGLTIGFMPHPNMQGLISRMELPDYVQTYRYVGNDIARTFARAAVLVTDYSSVAFNAAYMDRPVLYYQFDAERMFKGGHVGRAGYFSYERDGFGPVAYDLATAESHLAEVLQNGRRASGLYAERVSSTFPMRDGRACNRVTAAIIALDRRQDR